MKLVIVFLALLSNIAVAKDCLLQEVIDRENEFLSSALPNIAKASPLLENMTDLIRIGVLGIYIYLPNRYLVTSTKGGLRLIGHTRGRKNFYGCSSQEGHALDGVISYGKTADCLDCVYPKDLSGTDIVISSEQINENTSVRVQSSESSGYLESFIFVNDEYIQIMDKNLDLYKHIQFQLKWFENTRITSSSNGQNMLSPFLQKNAKKLPTNFAP